MLTGREEGEGKEGDGREKAGTIEALESPMGIHSAPHSQFLSRLRAFEPARPQGAIRYVPGWYVSREGPRMIRVSSQSDGATESPSG